MAEVLSERFAVLWSKQVSRKRKNRSYNDGFLNVTLPTTSGGRRATLVNECAVTLGVAVLPASLELYDDLEDITHFEGFVVDIIEAVGQDAGPGLSCSAPSEADAGSATLSKAQAAALPGVQTQPRTQQFKLPFKRKGGLLPQSMTTPQGRTAFEARGLVPAECVVQPAPSTLHQRPYHQSFMQPPRVELGGSCQRVPPGGQAHLAAGGDAKPWTAKPANNSSSWGLQSHHDVPARVEGPWGADMTLETGVGFTRYLGDDADQSRSGGLSLAAREQLELQACLMDLPSRRHSPFAQMPAATAKALFTKGLQSVTPQQQSCDVVQPPIPPERNSPGQYRYTAEASGALTHRDSQHLLAGDQRRPLPQDCNAKPGGLATEPTDGPLQDFWEATCTVQAAPQPSSLPQGSPAHEAAPPSSALSETTNTLKPMSGSVHAQAASAAQQAFKPQLLQRVGRTPAANDSSDAPSRTLLPVPRFVAGSIASRLTFPASGIAPQRTVQIPDTFQSVQQLASTWSSALHEEAALIFAGTATLFHEVLKRNMPAPRFSPLLARGGAPLPVPQPQSAPAALQAALRKEGVTYYARASLKTWYNDGGGRSRGFGARRAKCSSGAEDGDGTNKPAQHYLELSDCLRASAYRRGDLWAISNNTRLASETRCGHWVVMAKSLWHGPSPDGRMEVELLGERPRGMRWQQEVYAVQGPNAATELAAAALLADMSPAAHPLLPALLGCPPPVALESAPAAAPHSQEVETAALRHKLNPEQATLLAQAEAWTESASAQVNKAPVLLVHGPFGSGKTKLLVALILFLRGKAGAGGPAGRRPPRPRVLVAAHTNAAVDNILLGLAATGFDDMVRVGNLPRMHRGVLPFSVHAGGGSASAKVAAAGELREMLKHTSSHQEAQLIRAELEAVAAGAALSRRRRVKTAGVVGTTCCAAVGGEALEGARFDVVVVDEAAQVVEPLALAPALRAGCRFLVLAGDPCQLPPLVAPPQAPARGGAGLGRSMFQRLLDAGHPATLLPRQYRCHPQLSAVPNVHFYGGRLMDGCTASQRPALLPGCPPLAFLDVRGTEVYGGSGGSVCNPDEAAAVGRLLTTLTNGGVRRNAIGVICFYRAQVKCIRDIISNSIARAAADAQQQNPPGEAAEDTGEVQVATVDSFQGMEKDVIILSTVITRNNASFASDAQRLNVALTRARHHLLLAGHAGALQQCSPALAAIITACRKTPGGFHPSGRLLLHTQSHVCSKAASAIITIGCDSTGQS